MLRMDREEVEVGLAELYRLRAELLQEVEDPGVRLLPLLAVEAGARRLSGLRLSTPERQV